MNTPYIDIHTHSNTNDKDVFSLQSVFLQNYSNKTYSNPISVALHPWHSDQFTDIDVEKMLINASQNKKVIAIGETGIDKRCAVPISTQIEIFRKHIYYANKIGKPLIIHCVKGWEEMISLRKEAQTPLIIHGYNGRLQNALMLLKHNIYLSIGHSVLNAGPQKCEMVKQIPNNRLFVETDESDCDIREIYNKLAQLKNITTEQLKNYIFANFKTVFGFEPELGAY